MRTLRHRRGRSQPLHLEDSDYVSADVHGSGSWTSVERFRGPDGYLTGKRSSCGHLFTQHGTYGLYRKNGMAVFDPDTVANPLGVAQTLTLLEDHGNEVIDEIWAEGDFVDYGLGGHAQRLCLIIYAGHGWPDLAVLSPQIHISPIDFSCFYYSAALGGQVYIQTGVEVPAASGGGATTWASLGLPNLAEDGAPDGSRKGTVYRFGMRVDRTNGLVTCRFPYGLVLTLTSAGFCSAWPSQGNAVGIQLNRRTNSGDARYHLVGVSGRSRVIQPIEQAPALPCQLYFPGDASAQYRCPPPPVVYSGELEGWLDFTPAQWATGTRQAVGPDQWGAQKGLWFGIDASTDALLFSFSPDGSTSQEIKSSVIPAVGGPYGWVFDPGGAPYTGANGSATSPASVKFYKVDVDGFTPILINQAYYPSGVGGEPAQMASADGSSQMPAEISIGGRATSGPLPFAGTVRRAQLFGAGGRGDTVVGPVTGLPLIAGFDGRNEWVTAPAIASTTPGDGVVAPVGSTLVTLASPLQSALPNGIEVLIAGVTGAGATAVNALWHALAGSDKSHFTVPVTTTGAGAGGTVQLAYRVQRGIDPAGNHWYPVGTVKWLPDFSSWPDGSIAESKIAGLAADLIAVAATLSEFELNMLTKGVSNVNFATFTQASNRYLGFDRQSSGAVGDEIVLQLPLPLAAGTWTIAFSHTQAVSSGIYTITMSTDNVTYSALTTIDGFGASTVAARTEVAGLTIPAQVKYLKIKMLTKNASATNQVGRFQMIAGLRTGA